MDKKEERHTPSKVSGRPPEDRGGVSLSNSEEVSSGRKTKTVRNTGSIKTEYL